MPETAESTRKTETFNSFRTMNTQNERYGTEKQDFYLLENIMPIGDHKLSSVPGPSAVFATVPQPEDGDPVRKVYEMAGLPIGTDYIFVNADDYTCWALRLTDKKWFQIDGGVSFTDPDCSLWQGTIGIFVDPIEGYYAWPFGPKVPIAAIGASGAIDAGAHQWAVTFVNGTQESALGTVSAVLTVSGSQAADLTSIDLGPTGTEKRNIYRTKADAPTGGFFLVDTINDNTTTIYTDNKADSTLGSTAVDPLGVMYPIDKSKIGATIESYAGRVWISKDRTTEYTAPDSMVSFDPSAAAGSFVMTDSAFTGNITHLLAALDVLWIFGEASINQLSNVAVPQGTTTTTFSNVNIENSIGTQFDHSVLSYLRQVVFASKTGIVQQIGVTPQRVSDKIDGTYQQLDLSKMVSSCLAIINNILCYCVLVTYNDPDNNDTARKILLCLTFDGKWFIASQGDNLTFVTSIETGGTYRVFGADGKDIYELFSTDNNSTHKLKIPLYDFGDLTAGKELYRVMVACHLHGDQLMTLTLTPQTQQSAKRPMEAEKTNELIFFGTSDIFFFGASLIHFICKGFQLYVWTIGMQDKLIGFDLALDSDPFHISAYAMDYEIRESWGDVRA